MHRTTVALIASVLLSGASAIGCTTHQCDPDSRTLDVDDAGWGSWDVNCSYGCVLTWRSGSLVGGWLPFPGNQTYTFVLPPLPSPLPPNTQVDLSNATPPMAWVALAPPTDSGDPINFAASSGVEVEFTGLLQTASQTSLSVYNPSCQEYSLLVTLQVDIDAGILGSDAGSVDATGGGDLDAEDIAPDAANIDSPTEP